MQSSKKIFTDHQPDEIQRLWNDPESKILLLQQTSFELQDNGGIIWCYPAEQVISMMLEPKFAGLDEGLYVGRTVNRYMHYPKDVLPLVSEHQGLALAERCLIGLGFFWDRIAQMRERCGAPSPQYYMRVGQREFRRNGFPTLAENMPKWQEFLYYQFRAFKTNNIS